LSPACRRAVENPSVKNMNSGPNCAQ